MEGGLKGPASAGVATSPIQDLIDRLHESYRDVRDGAVASYIPELAAAEPDRLGIAVATADGYVYAAGHADVPFTIQSVSKPVLYGLALACYGREAVLERIGVEPSGDAFNAILFDEIHNRPFNAMVNAGAIVATSMVPGNNPTARLARILDAHRALVGHDVDIDDATYRSELATGHRNRAIAHLARNTGMLTDDVEAHLDLYFRQCAIRVSAVDLAIMAATFANGGMNPITGEQALPAEHVRDVLSVMTSCGMYDYAGEWELRVGLPAKSGVGGGIMAVLPGQLGIGVFSPRLDEHGNSYRGLRICEALARELDLHMLSHRGVPRAALRRLYHGTEVRSRRVRRAAARRILDEVGERIAVFEVHGDLFFANTEQLIRGTLSERADHLVLDVKRVASIDRVAAAMLRGLADGLTAAGKSVVFTGGDAKIQLALSLNDALFARDVDEALESFEDALLEGAGIAQVDAQPPIFLADFELVGSFDAGELETLAAALERRTYGTGQVLIREGAPADTLYFIEDGMVEVRIVRDDGSGYIRLGAVEPGNVVGELALLGGAARTAEAVAVSRTTTLELNAAAFDALGASHPAVTTKLLVAIGRSLAGRLRRANAEIAALSR
jgi:glutaminase